MKLGRPGAAGCYTLTQFTRLGEFGEELGAAQAAFSFGVGWTG